MRTYELAVVLTEEMGKDKAKAQKKLSALVVQVKGKITKTDVWGARDLAYPIKKQTRGWYAILLVELEQDKMGELEKLLKMDEKILRHLLVRVEK